LFGCSLTALLSLPPHSSIHFEFLEVLFPVVQIHSSLYIVTYIGLVA
jgi:hypothetical protein